MAIKCVTHSGKFHADDVFTWAMLLYFLDEELSLTRTRDSSVMAEGDIVFDVGGIYAPPSGRFDHHQREYTGPYSSAGMTLNWLEKTGKVSGNAAQMLRDKAIDYVDAVDNGRQQPLMGSTCITMLIDSFNTGCQTKEDFDLAFHEAANTILQFISRLMISLQKKEGDRDKVIAAMSEAEAKESNTIIFEYRVEWKDAYFENNGSNHRTEFVLYPNLEGAWQAMAISPERNSFAQKRSFPESWAGLKDGELAAVTGKSDAIFCHKNRFIAVFKSKESLLSAMGEAGLIQG